MKRQGAVLLVLVLAVATAGCAALLGPHAEYPAIAPVPGAGAPLAADYTFLFEDGAETVGVTIDAGLLAGARASEKEVMIRGDVPEGEWVAGAYRAQVLDPAQDRFYGDLLASFREVRDRRGLDGDRYLELMAAAVQQLPYVSAPGTAAKYPVETWADRSGDCDDKVLLLAGLLAREGYRVALLVFLPESHMALGVGCPAGYDYGGSGYAYLEVTNGSYVGTYPTGSATGSGSPRLRSWSRSGTGRPGSAPLPTPRSSRRRGARPGRRWTRSPPRSIAAGPGSRRTDAGSRPSARPAIVLRSTPPTHGTTLTAPRSTGSSRSTTGRRTS